MTAQQVLVDTCTFNNFAAVGSLTVLAAVLAGRGSWTEAVAAEVRVACATWPGLEAVLGWMPAPTIIDDPAELSALNTRRRAMGGDPRDAFDGLGEAESVHAILTRPGLHGAMFLTDDEPAAHYAQRQGIEVWRSADVLASAYELDLLGCPQAFDMLRAMRNRDRGVRVPDTHWQVCPPRG